MNFQLIVVDYTMHVVLLQEQVIRPSCATYAASGFHDLILYCPFADALKFYIVADG